MRLLALLALASCFKPVIAAGDPCEGGNDWCPDELTCIAHVCVLRASDAGVGDGVLTDGFPAGANAMFVTSATIAIQTSGTATLAAADALCTSSANDQQLDGHFVAWLSINGQTAAQHLGESVRGWYRVDGAPFADSLMDIANGVIFYPPSVDEKHHRVDLTLGGMPQPSLVKVLTNTFANGGSANECGDVGSTSGMMHAGTASGGIESWTALAAQTPCSDSMHVYCFQTTNLAGLDKPMRPPGGKLAFVTSTLTGMFYGGQGAAAADQLCMADVQDFDPNDHHTYRALIARDGMTPLERLGVVSPTGPWYRPDGVKVSDDLQRLDAPIDQHYDGTYESRLAWTGTAGVTIGGSSASTCQDWSTAGAQGVVSTTSITGFDDDGSPIDCNIGAAVYCVQVD